MRNQRVCEARGVPRGQELKMRDESKMASGSYFQKRGNCAPTEPQGDW